MGGCIAKFQRVITNYGEQKSSRIVDVELHIMKAEELLSRLDAREGAISQTLLLKSLERQEGSSKYYSREYEALFAATYKRVRRSDI